MEIKYPQFKYNREVAFMQNDDLCNHLQEQYFELAAIKDSMPYSPQNHDQFSYEKAKLEGKMELIKSLLSNFV
jgi:hypothetical protein